MQTYIFQGGVVGISGSVVLVGAAVGMIVVLLGVVFYFTKRPRLYRR